MPTRAKNDKLDADFIRDSSSSQQLFVQSPYVLFGFAVRSVCLCRATRLTAGSFDYPDAYVVRCLCDPNDACVMDLIVVSFVVVVSQAT